MPVSVFLGLCQMTERNLVHPCIQCNPVHFSSISKKQQIYIYIVYIYKCKCVVDDLNIKVVAKHLRCRIAPDVPRCISCMEGSCLGTSADDGTPPGHLQPVPG